MCIITLPEHLVQVGNSFKICLTKANDPALLNAKLLRISHQLMSECRAVDIIAYRVFIVWSGYDLCRLSVLKYLLIVQLNKHLLFMIALGLG